MPVVHVAEHQTQYKKKIQIANHQTYIHIYSGVLKMCFRKKCIYASTIYKTQQSIKCVITFVVDVTKHARAHFARLLRTEVDIGADRPMQQRLRRSIVVAQRSLWVLGRSLH